MMFIKNFQSDGRCCSHPFWLSSRPVFDNSNRYTPISNLRQAPVRTARRPTNVCLQSRCRCPKPRGVFWTSTAEQGNSVDRLQQPSKKLRPSHNAQNPGGEFCAVAHFWHKPTHEIPKVRA